MIKPRVSVVIPVYNGEKTIARSVESALSQQFHDGLEVIVVNDGSTDKTADILEKYGPAITVMHQENQRLPSARNAGIAMAQGEFVGFLDADDAWYTHKLKEQIGIFEKNAAIGLVSGGADCKSEEGALRRVENPIMSGRLTNVLLFRNPINVSSVLVRSCVLREMTRWFRTELLVCEDWDMWLRLSVRCEFHIDGNIVVAHYETRDGMSRKDPPRLLSVYGSTYELLFAGLRDEPVLGEIVKRKWPSIQTNIALMLALQKSRLDRRAARNEMLQRIAFSPTTVNWRMVCSILASLIQTSRAGKALRGFC